jgi:phenylalanyl-tRNA synthetase beta chain
MPTIDIPFADLCTLAGAKLTRNDVKRHLELVKGEVKEKHSTEETLRVELQDTNRPDLWCIEGVARQFRQWLAKSRPWRQDYAFLEKPGNATATITVDPSVEKVRPFVAAFKASGWKVDDATLKAFIQAQETLSRNFGRKRASVAIGIYDGSKIQYPVTYKAVPLDDKKHAFVPLPPQGQTGFDQPMTPAEILEQHPTGREFRPALGGHSVAPLLVDAKGQVLSFPPVINSRALGRVEVGMTELFVEVTGTVLDHVLLATNILAANVRDRGATITPVATQYPYETPRGKSVTAPHSLPEKRVLEVPLSRFRVLLGEPSLSEKDVLASLRAYGLEAQVSGGFFNVEAPPYRMDYLHEVDAVEDFAMSRGYDAFVPLMPEEFTVGRLAPTTEWADTARDVMIGFGFEEEIANILTEERLLRGAMNLDGAEGFAPIHGGHLVKIANVMNKSYSSVRDWILPSLLEVESRSSGATYPHRVFEAGEVAVADDAAPLRSRTEQRLGALIAHETVSFSEAQSYLHQLLFRLGIQTAGTQGAKRTYTLAPIAHPSFIPGRAASVVVNGKTVGLLGELHPEVLAGAKGFGIRMPCAGFEITLGALR